MFQEYAKAFRSSQSQEFLSKLNKSDLPDAKTGIEFMAKVVHWLDQDLNKKLPTRYQFADSNDRWRVKIVGGVSKGEYNGELEINMTS